MVMVVNLPWLLLRERGKVSLLLLLSIRVKLAVGGRRGGGRAGREGIGETEGRDVAIVDSVSVRAALGVTSLSLAVVAT